MDYKEFIKYYTSIKHVPGTGFLESGRISNTYRGVPWGFRYKYAEEVDEDFGCDFVDNRCVRERNENMEEWWNTLGRNSRHVSYCCSSCYISVGNIRLLPNDEEVLREIASLFDYENRRGFWRENQGCILPRRYRSTLCLTDRCSYLLKNVKPSRKLLQKIYNLTNITALWRKER